MRIKLFALVCAITATSPALAEPVHLDCWLPRPPTGKQPWSITVNEASSTVVVTNPLITKTYQALFTADQINWHNDNFWIDRTTLSFTSHFKYGGVRVGQPEIGQCKVSIKKRAI